MRYSARISPRESYSLDTTGLDELIQTQVEAMAARWDKPARNGEISGFDKESNSFSSPRQARQALYTDPWRQVR